MARVHVTSCFLRRHGEDRCLNEYRRLERCRSLDRFGEHEYVDDPADADLVLFSELGNWGKDVPDAVMADPVYIRNEDRCIHFNPRLKAPPVTPGIFGSALRDWCAPGHACTSHYLETTLEREYITPQPINGEGYLYSFRGSSETWVGRRSLLALNDDRALLEDTSVAEPTTKTAYRDRFVASIADSKFVVCPRGVGPASLRVFEVLRAGRVPVIVADDWLPPHGPDWESFAVFVREADIETIPGVLREKEREAQEMAARALEAHREWFAEDVSFHRVVEWALMIQADRNLPTAIQHRRRMKRSYKMFKVTRATRTAVRRFFP